MNRVAAVLMVLALGGLYTGASAQEPSAADQQALRARVVERFDIVPVTGGVALRPKSQAGDVRLVEITEGGILVNGTPVSGRELRDRIGGDADLVLRLSYLSAEARRALAAPQPPGLESEPVEAPSAPAPPPAPAERTARRGQRSSGDRVRVFGDVTVREDEYVTGDVVAVLGSVDIQGEVGGQVVAVLGSVNLGPKASVGHDVVSVGGRVRRTEGSQIRGGVTEVSMSEPNVHFDFEPLVDWRGFYLFDTFSALPRLLGSTFRLLLLVLLASIALVVARPTVEASAQRAADSPVQATLVGIAAELLLLPALFLTAIVLVITIIGIPLLLLMPFLILLLLLLALAGFSGTVYAVGQWTRRRLNLGSVPPIVDIFLGVTMILLPLLLGRLIALVGWPGAPLAFLLLAVGFGVEMLAWACGFGAVLTNAFSRWQARRAARTAPPPAPA